jgi:hypothetical protein
MKHFYRFLAISFSVLGIVSCGGDGYSSPTPTPTPTPNSITFKATLNGANAGTGSSAMGTGTLIFSNTTKKFSITVTYSGMTATAAHIHTSTSTPPGAIVFPLIAGGGGGYPTTYSLDNQILNTAQEADLKAGSYYVNIHSNAFPDGEIKGTLIKQ